MTDRKYLQARLMHAYICAALEGQDNYETAAKIARILDQQQHVIVASFDRGADGEPIPESLADRVELPVADGGWACLCTIPWPLLGMTREDCEFELINVRMQHDGEPSAS
jgi:hypothetical protein